MKESQRLLETYNKYLTEDLSNNTVNEKEICKELQKVRNIIKVEYNSNFEDYSHKGCYILYLSKYFKRLANQWSIGPKALSDRIETMADIREIMSKYYEKGMYSVNVSDDYDGYWYVEIKKVEK